jgi:hypothetical protein
MPPRQRAGQPATTVKHIDSDGRESNVVEMRPGDFDLEAIVQQRADALGLEDGERITFVWRSERFSMPYPMFATDEWKDGLEECTDDEEIGRYCLGDDQYERFISLDGRAGFIALILQEANSKVVGAGPDPTQSSRSSRRAQRRRR